MGFVFLFVVKNRILLLLNFVDVNFFFIIEICNRYNNYIFCNYKFNKMMIIIFFCYCLFFLYFNGRTINSVVIIYKFKFR